MTRTFPALLAVLLLAPALPAQYDPPDPKEPDAETLKAIKEKTQQLRTAVEALRGTVKDDPQLTGVEIYLKAAEWIVRHREWYTSDSGKQTVAVLDRGLLRAEQAKAGKFPWLDPVNQTIVRGYRSGVDGSVQPYAVSYPADYGKDPKKKWRVDVDLHGRDASLTEVKFLFQRPGGKDAPKEQDYVRIEIYGRGNNAYRWAGESDVLQVLEHFFATEEQAGRKGLVDRRLVMLRGFSMGGAGTWHLGLHKPDWWCVIGPGAGFTKTRGYIKNLPEKLPDYQEKCLHIYDAVDYAENAAMVPVVAYSGEKDPQRQAAVNIEERLKELGIPMTHLIAPGLEHRFPPEWQKVAHAEYAKYSSVGRPPFPERVRFVTYTLKYPRCEWVTIRRLHEHFARARVDALWKDRVVTVSTENVRAFSLFPPDGTPAPKAVVINGQRVEVPVEEVSSYSYHMVDQRWGPDTDDYIELEWGGRAKLMDSQGPIDDAFTQRFLCVVGTGTPWHRATAEYARLELERFIREWDRYFRGRLLVKKDTEVMKDDLATNHLILFGDPSSNALIAKCLPGLPLKWTKDRITFAGKEYAAGEHVPVMVYPNRTMRTARYVVLNSGHTFHAADFRGTNALLYPRLGDFAILKPTPTEKDAHAAEVVTAGLFDDDWKVPAK